MMMLNKGDGMRVIATWMGGFAFVLVSAAGYLRLLLQGMTITHFYLNWILLPLQCITLPCTIWAFIYLMRLKDKATHEKIGMAFNLYYFVTSAIGVFSVLKLTHP
jgi:hypothetical protein